MLAGGEGDEHNEPTDSGSQAAGGLIAGMSTVAHDEAHRVVTLAVADIAPHPFNDAARSEAHPGDLKWDELVNAVRANGVRLPVLVVPRHAFLTARPSAAGSIPPDARYVLVYGHRRRAAAIEAGRQTVPAVVDEAIMADNGDLDAMAAENLGRQDLSDLAEADLFARYSELGLSQRSIAERLGVDQATVSRRLALLLLAPELRQAVQAGELPSAEAAALAGRLPFGPPRRWQKSPDPEQHTDQRRAEQVAAQRLILRHSWSASRAAERVVAERDARHEAEEMGIALVSSAHKELGDYFSDFRISREEYQPGTDIFGAINPSTGTLELYRRDGAAEVDSNAPIASPGRAPKAGGRSADPAFDESADSAEGEHSGADAVPSGQPWLAALPPRRQACEALIAITPTGGELLRLLVRQSLSGVAARSHSTAVRSLLARWDVTPNLSSEKGRHRAAWARAVAAAEVHTGDLKGGPWDQEAVSHLGVLMDRVGYEPTVWEREQLAAGGL
jgi:ParB family chromosome partitioning protein